MSDLFKNLPSLKDLALPLFLGVSSAQANPEPPTAPLPKCNELVSTGFRYESGRQEVVNIVPGEPKKDLYGKFSVSETVQKENSGVTFFQERSGIPACKP